jgi:hypothetical protein
VQDVFGVFDYAPPSLAVVDAATIAVSVFTCVETSVFLKLDSVYLVKEVKVVKFPLRGVPPPCSARGSPRRGL